MAVDHIRPHPAKEEGLQVCRVYIWQLVPPVNVDSERDRRVEIADNNTGDTFTRRLLQSAQ
jgi:hypothetical protein